ncbi:perilipin-2 [Microcaecilia unicolor]|uniref:Perilipin n=1 Tax=Microcaecilia unicolor TaxID=1415580 RepID=A0A6P7X3A1_9AMPH|nr:perilipin-2-like [Microcaecilia unicolor]XP_030050063.1 perilipin-2-like [Microcaecilia unicolor]
MASVVAEPQQNVMLRVANLPLVSSAYAMVSSAYTSTKENHPYLKSACEVAEKGVKSITAAALTSANPIFQKLEPQIALANKYACIELDKIEEKLPILYQPADKVVANATDLMVGAKEAMTGAKDTVAHTVTGVLDKTKGVVSDSMNKVMSSHMVQMVSAGVDAALTKSEALVDHHLPQTAEEAIQETSRVEGFEAGTQKQSYDVRLRSLFNKVRRRAYEQALTKVKDAKIRSQDVISQLGTAINLHIESRTLAIAQDLTSQLQTTCLNLIRGLPQYIQDQAHNVSSMAGNIYHNFRFATIFRGVSEQLLNTSKGQLNKMKESLDEVIDYLVNNTPLNWLLDPFYPHLLQLQDEKKREQEEEKRAQANTSAC